MLCPRTHYDVVKTFRPGFVAEIESNVALLPDSEYARIDADIDNEHFIETVRTAMAGYARATLQNGGYNTLGMSDKELIGTIPGERATQMLSASRLEYLFVGNYAMAGKKTFFFGDRLTRKLADTELNMPSEMLKPPFPTSMFVYDSQTARDALSAIHNIPGPTEGVVTAYVTYYRLNSGGIGLGIFLNLTTRRNEVPMAVLRSLSLAEGESVETALRTDWTKINGSKREHTVVGYETTAPADDSVFSERGLRMVRIVANSILYLASADPDVSGPESLASVTSRRHVKPKELRTLTASTTAVEYIEVGRRSSDYAMVEPSGKAVMTHRIKVRGHWKNQVHGPGMTLRRFIHIEPYWKGPDAAEVINKPYLVR